MGTVRTYFDVCGAAVGMFDTITTSTGIEVAIVFAVLVLSIIVVVLTVVMVAIASMVATATMLAMNVMEASITTSYILVTICTRGPTPPY